MACEHAETCVVCLRVELDKVRKERDILLTTLEQVVSLRAELKQKKVKELPPRPSVAVTPPDRPPRKSISKPPEGSLLQEIVATAEGKRGKEKQDQLMKGTFGATKDQLREKMQEDLGERAENLDPASPRNSAPRPPETVEEGRFDPPKPTAPYETNPWKKAADIADAGQMVAGIMAEQLQKKVGQELAESLQQEQRDQEKQREPPRRGRSKQRPAGRQRKKSPARGSVKKVK